MCPVTQFYPSGKVNLRSHFNIPFAVTSLTLQCHHSSLKNNLSTIKVVLYNKMWHQIHVIFLNLLTEIVTNWCLCALAEDFLRFEWILKTAFTTNRDYVTWWNGWCKPPVYAFEDVFPLKEMVNNWLSVSLAQGLSEFAPPVCHGKHWLYGFSDLPCKCCMCRLQTNRRL